MTSFGSYSSATDILHGLAMEEVAQQWILRNNFKSIRRFDFNGKVSRIGKSIIIKWSHINLHVKLTLCEAIFLITWITNFFSPELGWVTGTKTPPIEGSLFQSLIFVHSLYTDSLHR